MKLLEIFDNKTRRSGFTLIELLLVITLVSIIGLFVSPIGISFYQTQLLNETSDGLVSALRQAQSFSVSGKNDQSFGVRILTEAYVVFAGDTYDTRTISEDQVFPIATTVVITGTNEFVFSKITGVPSSIGTLLLSSGSKETAVNILESGHVER